MRALLALLITLPTTGIAEIQCQVDYNARLGLTLATNLLKDRVIEQVEVRQSLAPTLALGASLPLAPRYQVGLEAILTTSGYHSKEGNSETDLGTLHTGSILLGLDGPISSRLRWRTGLGLLHYWPSEDRGIFLQGGSTEFLAGAGLDYRPRLMPKWDLMVSLRYDFHRFTTDELKTRGFTGSQGVQRISASLGLASAQR